MNSGVQIRLSNSFTNKKRTFSLPKTQPTRSSSSQKIFNSDLSKYEQIETCPEVTEFREIDDSLYIHKMNIDYGHLEEPVSWNKNFIQDNDRRGEFKAIEEICQKETERQSPFENIPDIPSFQATVKTKSLINLNKSLPMVQERSSNNKAYENCESNKKVENKQNYQANAENISKKSLFKSSNSKQNSMSKLQNPSKDKIDQSNPKLRQVLANKLHSQNSTAAKNPSQQSTYRVDGLKDSNYDKLKTHRRVPHCRIVKSYVGGNKMQIKIINYPDSSEYMKLCGL